MSEAERGPVDFFVRSLYGGASREPLVSIKLRDVAVMVPPAKAREMALMLIEAAETAVSDAFMFEWMRDYAGEGEPDGGDRVGSVFMGAFREWRERRKVDEPKEDR